MLKTYARVESKVKALITPKKPQVERNKKKKFILTQSNLNVLDYLKKVTRKETWHSDASDESDDESKNKGKRKKAINVSFGSISKIRTPAISPQPVRQSRFQPNQDTIYEVNETSPLIKQNNNNKILTPHRYVFFLTSFYISHNLIIWF